MKKRTLLLVASLIVSLAIATTGTLAYLTDTDEDVNVMTLGNVQIEQHEMKRADGVAHNATLKEGDLVPFVDGIKLYPAYPKTDKPEAAYEAMREQADSIKWGTYVHDNAAWNGLWSDDNLVGAVDKMIFVENTGTSDAYVRTLIAVESPEGVKIGYGYQHADIVLNMNGNNRYTNGNGVQSITSVGTIEVGGTTYEVYEFCYSNAMKPGEWTRPSLLQVVMTNWATNDTVALLGDTYEILALSQGVQVTNMETLGAQGALDTAFGKVNVENATKWFSEMAGLPVTTVSTADELTAALAEGGTVVLTADVTLENKNLAVNEGVAADLVLGGHTITVTNDANAASCAIDNKGDLTISGGTITYAAANPDPAYGYGTNTINNSGNLVIEGAEIINTTNGGSSNAIDNAPGATLVINSGTIKAEKIAVRLRDNSKVTINGGEISGSRAVQVHLFQNVKKPTELVINGGTLNSTTNLALYSTANGAVTHAYNSITITGGTFNGDVLFGGGNKEAKETVTITGGTFSGYLGRYLANDGWEDIAKP